FYRLGTRYMTLTHWRSLDWATASTDTARRGLSPFGKQVVLEMNRLGMLVDLSHVNDETMSDALHTSRAPVIFSHSSARALTNHPRDVPDSILKLVAANRGVVMVNVNPGFVSEAVRVYGDTVTIDAHRFRHEARIDVHHDDAAIRRHKLQNRVGDVARVIGERAGRGMGENHGCPRRMQRVGHGLVVHMRQIHQHA